MAVALTGLFSTEQTPEPVQSAASSQTTQEQDDVIIKSLTNNTQNVVFEPHNTLSYVGYIEGAGYGSYQFYAQHNQRFTASLADQSNKFEMIMFGPETQVIKSGKSYTIPANGLYELRVVFKNDVERKQEQDQARDKSVPQIYNITLSLKNPILPKMSD
ncbi:hypothetical protein [Brackiella oedipodis]|uniref:hypothetical protein n=1 Tax=Brackiella oedipodis TaxID=124225 RepID=UPI0012EC150D|nr:hypothetical protein [Brackiella oedipodis]